MTDADRDELSALCEGVIERRLTPEQRGRLERLVLDSAEARRFYVEYLHQHAGLQWSLAAPSFLATAPVAVPAAPVRRRWLAPLLGLAAALVVGVAVWAVMRPGSDSVATLAEGKACKWEAGTLPTEVGARLTAGRLRLAEGLARIVFDNGAEVTLEAPAELELIDARRCVLHAGRLVAKVPPPAIGFVVDTPTAVLTDYGTEFGVHVRDGRTTDVQVFNGVVDARHRGSDEVQRMLTGRNLRFSPDAVADFDPQAAQPPGSARPGPGGRAVHVSTATGRGKDAYVQPIVTTKNVSDVLLLVKNTVPEKSDWNRKAYVGLDLTPVRGRRIVDAQLSLSFAPTEMGFASEVPDATFTVYGLTDESLDGWDEQAVRWADAPANRPGGAALDPAKVVRIGSFEIVQGELTGTRGVMGPALVEFLNRDTNGLATFILVRDTAGSGRNDLVHGFANKDHPTLPPPTLKLTVAP